MVVWFCVLLLDGKAHTRYMPWPYLKWSVFLFLSHSLALALCVCGCAWARIYVWHTLKHVHIENGKNIRFGLAIKYFWCLKLNNLFCILAAGWIQRQQWLRQRWQRCMRFKLVRAEAFNIILISNTLQSLNHFSCLVLYFRCYCYFISFVVACLM